MPADQPTILATSGGLRPGRRTRLEFSPLTDYAVELSGVTGRSPRVCVVATALGDNPAVLHSLYEAAGYEPRGRIFMEAGIEHIAMEKHLS